MIPFDVSTLVIALLLLSLLNPVTSTSVIIFAPAACAFFAIPCIAILLLEYPPLFSCKIFVIPFACQSLNIFFHIV